MANPTFNLGLNVLSTADTTTDWSQGSLEPDIKKEGLNSLVTAIRNSGTVTYTIGTATDMSATDTHLRLWLFHSFFARLDLQSAGGIQLFVSDGTNTNFYYVGGSDTHEGAWELFQADLANPSVNNGANLSSITSAGFVLSHATAARNIDNTWYDYLVYGTGYGIYGGTAGDKVSWNTVAASDLANGYGVTQLQNGVYFINAEIEIGDNVGTNDCYFDGSNEVIVFYDTGESDSLYKINVVGNATGITSASFDNSVIKSAATRFEFSSNDANVDFFEMIGTTMDGAGTVDFASGQEIRNTVFVDCGIINPRTATFRTNTISAYTELGDSGSLLITDTTNISNLTFNSSGTGHAIYITTAGEYTFSNYTYSGYATTDGTTGNEVLYNNSGGSVTLNIVGGDVPTIRNGTGSTTTVNNNIILTFTGVQPETEIRVYSAGTTTEIAGIEQVSDVDPNNANLRTFGFTVAGSTSIDYVIISKTYENIRVEDFVTPSTNSTIPIQQRFDRNYLNPNGEGVL